MLTEDVFESEDLELLSEEEVMEINGGCGSGGGPPTDYKQKYYDEKKRNLKGDLAENLDMETAFFIYDLFN